MALAHKRWVREQIEDARRPDAVSRLVPHGSFTGRVWVGSKPRIDVDLTASDRTRYLSIKLDGTGYTWVTEMPESQPVDAVVYDLAYTHGDIHLPGNFAP